MNWLKKYHPEKWLQKENLVILVMAGILLVVIALPTSDKGEERGRNTGTELTFMGEEEIRTEEAAKGEDVSASDTEIEDTLEYVEQLEIKLESILSRMEGAGEVHVMITLRESEELIVEKDILEKGEETIYETGKSETKPYVVKTLFPQIEGVAVIASGAGSGSVAKNISDMIQALFDIEPHKIKVAGGRRENSVSNIK